MTFMTFMALLGASALAILTVFSFQAAVQAAERVALIALYEKPEAGVNGGAN